MPYINTRVIYNNIQYGNLYFRHNILCVAWGVKARQELITLHVYLISMCFRPEFIPDRIQILWEKIYLEFLQVKKQFVRFVFNFTHMNKYLLLLLFVPYFIIKYLQLSFDLMCFIPHSMIDFGGIIFNRLRLLRGGFALKQSFENRSKYPC